MNRTIASAFTVAALLTAGAVACKPELESPPVRATVRLVRAPDGMIDVVVDGSLSGPGALQLTLAIRPEGGVANRRRAVPRRAAPRHGPRPYARRRPRHRLHRRQARRSAGRQRSGRPAIPAAGGRRTYARHPGHHTRAARRRRGPSAAGGHGPRHPVAVSVLAGRRNPQEARWGGSSRSMLRLSGRPMHRPRSALEVGKV